MQANSFVGQWWRQVPRLSAFGLQGEVDPLYLRQGVPRKCFDQHEECLFDPFDETD